MTITPEINAELRVAGQMAGKYSSFFSEFGFSLAETHMDRLNLTADSLVLSFKNSTSEVTIRIAYFPPFRDMTRGFVATLTNGKGENIYLAEYLKQHRREDVLATFQDTTGSEVSAFWKKSFETFAHLFRTDLKPIIEGRQWETTPLDWGGYR